MRGSWSWRLQGTRRTTNVRACPRALSPVRGATVLRQTDVERLFARVPISSPDGDSRSHAWHAYRAGEWSYLFGFIPEVVIVGSTTASDAMSSFSNFGACVDVFAPGSNIEAAAASSDTASVSMSGTSMATPHVSGAGTAPAASTLRPSHAHPPKLLACSLCGLLTCLREPLAMCSGSHSHHAAVPRCCECGSCA
mmetsp:Transcript_72837/g.144768  ORF Transcript_72837/g.144768 Transcript_72837/m.144768 type:complete len:195 (+) Transcript_72837:965-1549(+)